LPHPCIVVRDESCPRRRHRSLMHARRDSTIRTLFRTAGFTLGALCVPPEWRFERDVVSRFGWTTRARLLDSKPSTGEPSGMHLAEAQGADRVAT